jgi:hypothetical protein
MSGGRKTKKATKKTPAAEQTNLVQKLALGLVRVHKRES